MDDELQRFEAELKRLQPTQPSRALAARIDRELSAPQSRQPSAKTHWAWFAALPAAAALAILLSRPTTTTPSSAPHAAPVVAAPASVPSETLKPVAAENVLYSARDEGLVVLEDGTPARRERLQFVDTITWKNPHTNASLRWTVPREEVRVVPISFQ
jgi:hypothetical protein